MVERRVKVTAELDASGMVKGAKDAEQAVERAGKAMKKAAGESDQSSKTQESAFKRMARAAEENEQAFRTAGAALTGFGAVTVGALGASAKAAIDWETAFAGVMKTVDDSEAGYASLSEELREMARTLPSSHTEIAAVAEAAGQLGVAREDITAFTRTMIDLGETTNLTADEAATGIAQIANVMGTSGDDIDNFGATLVALGNAGASTESEILQLTQRLAGASNLIGATEADALALANAMASVGIEAQLGGGSMSRAMIQMNSAVLEGGGSLEEFARVSGMTSREFAQQWGEDPVVAVQQFVAGLDKIQKNGGDAASALRDVGLKGTENAQVFLRLAGASDMLAEGLDMSKVAWQENTALADEAAKRYETVASQLQVFRNNIADAGISLGETFLPVIAAASEKGSDFLKWISNLPGPIRDIAAWSGAAAGGTTLLAGALMLAVPAAHDTVKAFQALGVIGPKQVGWMKNTASFLTGPWGLALAGATAGVMLWANEQAKAKAEAEELRATLDAQSGALTQNSREWFANTLESEGVYEYAEKLGLSLRLVTDAAMGNSDAIREMNRQIDATVPPVKAGQRGLTELQQAAGRVKGAVDGTNETLARAREENERLAAASGDVARSQKSLAAESSRLTAQAEAYAAAQGLTTDSVLKFVPAAERAAAAGEEAAEEYAKWIEDMTKLDASFIDTSGALKAVEEETRAWAEEQAESTKTAKDSWQDFVDDAKFSLGTFIEELERQVAAQEEWETNMLLLTGRLSEAAIQMLEGMGPAGAQAAAALVDATDEEIQRFNDVAAQRGGEAGTSWANAYADALASPVFAAAMNKFGQDTAEEIARQIAAGEMTVQQAIEEYDLQAWINVGARPDDYDEQVKAARERAAEVDATIPIDGDSRKAEERLSTLEEIVKDSTPSITIEATDDLAQGVRLGLIEDVEGSAPSIKINADPLNAYSELRAFLSAIPSSVSIGLKASPFGGMFGMIPGFMAGGYTGDFDKQAVVGAVHGQEFVSTASTTADPYNRQALEFMHSGRSIREWSPPAAVATSNGGGGNTTVSVPVQTFERADPLEIGAHVAWNLRGR